MQADDAGLVGRIEMARDGIADVGFEFVERVGLREDGETEGAGFVAAFGRFIVSRIGRTPCC
jgi:hypothetical protein